MLRLPVDESGDAVMLPLEIGSSDSPLAAVYRGAADVVYSAEELDFVSSDRRVGGGS